MSKRRRFRQHDEEFKRNAVQLCLNGEKKVREIAEELGVATVLTGGEPIALS